MLICILRKAQGDHLIIFRENTPKSRPERRVESPDQRYPSSSKLAGFVPLLREPTTSGESPSKVKHHRLEIPTSIEWYTMNRRLNGSCRVL